jgi:hypothetical protein
VPDELREAGDRRGVAVPKVAEADDERLARPIEPCSNVRRPTAVEVVAEHEPRQRGFVSGAWSCSSR